jgi:hypothetical protein
MHEPLLEGTVVWKDLEGMIGCIMDLVRKFQAPAMVNTERSNGYFTVSVGGTLNAIHYTDIKKCLSESAWPEPVLGLFKTDLGRKDILSEINENILDRDTQ